MTTRSIRQRQLLPRRARGMGLVSAPAERLSQGTEAAMVREMVAPRVAVNGAKAAVGPAAVAAAVITIRFLVARTSRVRRESWKNPSRNIRKRLAKTRLPERLY